MDNSILIWKYLLPVLQQNSELAQYLDTDDYMPCVDLSIQDENGLTPYPYIVYRRDNVTPSYTKHIQGISGWVNNITISLSVYSDNYDEGLYIANLVRDALENYSYADENIVIYHLEMTAINEYWTGSAYEQRITFITTTK